MRTVRFTIVKAPALPTTTDVCHIATHNVYLEYDNRCSAYTPMRLSYDLLRTTMYNLRMRPEWRRRVDDGLRQRRSAGEPEQGARRDGGQLPQSH
jgi:hypothetical protein